MFLRMGVKRPLEEENLPELSFEQPKQHYSYKKLTLVTEDFPSRPTDPILNAPGESKRKLCDLDPDGVPEKGCADSFIVDKELEVSIPLSLATPSSSSRREHVEEKDFSRYYDAPSFIDLAIPRPPLEQYEHPYMYLLNCPPRKEVPVGPDHQVDVPVWDCSANAKKVSGSSNFTEDELEKKLMGTCILPSPTLNGLSIDGYTVGRGRTDCGCPDMGSVRCVQQHVREARERLRYTIGDEIFLKLGFNEMGEEVARRWSAEDEQFFHKVVISNPASLGRDFWKDLAFVFPSRAKKELVSYYFNVFMLHRRRVQNRSYLLRIDSDDDEEVKFTRGQSLLVEDGNDLQLSHEDFYLLHVGEDEDSDVGSLSEQELDAGWVDGYRCEPEIVNETWDGIIQKKDDVNEAGTYDSNVPKQYALGIDNVTAQMSEQESDK